MGCSMYGVLIGIFSGSAVRMVFGTVFVLEAEVVEIGCWRVLISRRY